MNSRRDSSRRFYSAAGVVLLLGLGVCRLAAAEEGEIRVRVFGLFHARELVVEPSAAAEALTLWADGAPLRLEATTGRVQLLDGRLEVTIDARRLTAESVVAGQGNSFELSVPDKIRRRFEGVLELRPAGDEILAIVTMPRRVYLASTLAVEASPESSPEALAAQAIVSRSFAAAPRHRGYDVCDTTHCQFTGAPPPNDSKMWLAVEKTDALLLTYLGRPIEALFTRSCSGATKTLADIGLARDGGYPFYRAPCTRCALKPDRWQRELPAPAALPLLARPHQEAARLEAVRSLGWDAAPSNSYEIAEQNGRIRLTGVGYGHGVGYCQRGGAELASQGWRFDAILRRYFPNTILSELK